MLILIYKIIHICICFICICVQIYNVIHVHEYTCKYTCIIVYAGRVACSLSSCYVRNANHTVVYLLHRCEIRKNLQSYILTYVKFYQFNSPLFQFCFSPILLIASLRQFYTLSSRNYGMAVLLFFDRKHSAIIMHVN